MTTTLITFLGRAPKHQRSYRTTRYTFPDGHRTAPVAFLGWPLREWLACDRVVVLGTAGSMWDHLFEGDLDLGDQGERQRLHLIDAVERKAVERRHLAPLEPVLSERLGHEALLLLIPYCRTEAEQVELLRIMADAIARGAAVHLDITHGFRHLPMLALLAALHLRVVKQARIEGIWYGAYDEDTGEAPVHDLAGLLRIADWVAALTTFDKDGDYGVFAPLLGEIGEPLRRAAFFERTTNPVKAREALNAWREPQDSTDPAYHLFRDALHGRIAWRKEPTRPEWERELARRYLERGDYLRAALFAVESCISREAAAAGEDINDRGARERARDRLIQSNRAGFGMLAALRNAMAHGVRPKDQRVRKAISDETTLTNTLRSLFAQLLPDQ
jgi:CRISPR-associated Csx2 family protein